MVDVQSARLKPGEDGTHITFCRICEAFCGLTAEVEAGKIIRIGPDRQNPHSHGHICIKGTAMLDVVNDEDRVLHPLRRIGDPGVFERVSWEQAIEGIAQTLEHIEASQPDMAIGGYIGNPLAFSSAHLLLGRLLLKKIGVTKLFSATSQDSNPRHVASYLLYGWGVRLALPDLKYCNFLIILGANPLVSHGSVLTAPRIREDLQAIAARGRVVVVDPRATETAKKFEHVAIAPDKDVWLLGAMLNLIFNEKLADEEFLAASTCDVAALRNAVAGFSLERAGLECGLEPEAIRELAIAFASEPRAAIYSRAGICRGRFSTLTNFFVDCLNIVSGKFGRKGGWRFGSSPLDGGSRMAGGYEPGSSRIGGLPAVLGCLPSVTLADEILTPGDGQIRAMLLAGGNAALSAPGGDRLAQALNSLDLLVSLDFYMTETNKFAHYILPSTTFLEREDVPLLGLNQMVRPFMQYTDAVVPPAGEAKPEYLIYQLIVAARARMKSGNASQNKLVYLDPMMAFDEKLRASRVGDKFGKKPDGLSLEGLKASPHGELLDDGELTQDSLPKIAHSDGKIHLWHPQLSDELERLFAEGQKSTVLRLFGRRELKSINSWMHNVERLVRSQRPTLLMHPDDAAERNMDDGQNVIITANGEQVEATLEITVDVVRGSVNYPHGWGHAGGWKRANGTDGTNINALAPRGFAEVEQLSGASFLDGIPVEVLHLR